MTSIRLDLEGKRESQVFAHPLGFMPGPK